MVRVIPILFNEENRELRKKYFLKLSGLPFRIISKDIYKLVEQVSSQTCFISKSPYNYKNLKCAYINFKYEEDMLIAKDTHVNYKTANRRSYNLFWNNPDDQLCHKCGNNNYVVINCKSVKLRTNNRMNQNRWKISVKIYQQTRIKIKTNPGRTLQNSYQSIMPTNSKKMNLGSGINLLFTNNNNPPNNLTKKWMKRR